MNGVDLFDQKRSYYDITSRQKKWWKYLLFFVIMASIVNSFILFDLSNRPHKQPRNIILLNFQKNLTKQLIGDFTSRKGTKNTKTRHVSHKLVKGTNRKCKFCAVNEISGINGNPVKTSFMCEACAVPLCQYVCFDIIEQKKFLFSFMRMNLK